MHGQGRGRIRVEPHVESALLELPVIGQLAALCERRLGVCPDLPRRRMVTCGFY